MGRPFGAVDRSRTDDLRITSASLYQLSYNGLILWCILQVIRMQALGKGIWFAINAAPHNLLTLRTLPIHGNGVSGLGIVLEW